jgi:hypothetical protein
LFAITAESIELAELNLAATKVRPVEADKLSAAKVVEPVHVIAAQIVRQ